MLPHVFFGYTCNRYFPLTPTKRLRNAAGKSSTRNASPASWSRMEENVSCTSASNARWNAVSVASTAPCFRLNIIFRK
jgi:hypothetical protein